MTAYIHASELHDAMKTACVDYNTFLRDEEIANVREALVNETKDNGAIVRIDNIYGEDDPVVPVELVGQAAHALLQAACNKLCHTVEDIRSILKHDVAFDIDYEKLAYKTISDFGSDIPLDVRHSEQRIIIVKA